MTLFSQAGSLNHANPTHQRVSDLVKRTIDISGRRCLEQFERLSPGTSWAKMFLACLVGTGDWFSTRCKLTWKLKGTKYNRLYFQLQVSTLPIDEIESGLWPIPTPQARDWKGGSGRAHKGEAMDLPMMAKKGMLPTPTTRDYKGARTSESLSKSDRNETNSLPDAFHQPGKSSQLNPRFVAEMMGFPTNWTELPFQSGDKNQ